MGFTSTLLTIGFFYKTSLCNINLGQSLPNDLQQGKRNSCEVALSA